MNALALSAGGKSCAALAKLVDPCLSRCRDISAISSKRLDFAWPDATAAALEAPRAIQRRSSSRKWSGGSCLNPRRVATKRRAAPPQGRAAAPSDIRARRAQLKHHAQLPVYYLSLHMLSYIIVDTGFGNSPRLAAR